MTSYQVGLIQGDELLRWWPDISESIDQSPPSWVKRCDRTALLAMALDGDIQVWGAGINKEFQILLITRIVELGSKILVCEFMSGKNLDLLLDPISTALEFCGMKAGCEEIVVKGRWGWKRKLEHLGYELRQIEMSKPIAKRVH